MANFSADDPIVRRHHSDWKSFTTGLAVSAVTTAAVLLLMAAFLL